VTQPTTLSRAPGKTKSYRKKSVGLVIYRKKKKKKRSTYKWKTDVQSMMKDRHLEGGVSEDRLLSKL
jgi:hypothetical protein